MNKDMLNQIPAEEQSMASRLSSLVDEMQLSQSFQWELEAQLIDTANKKIKHATGWREKILPALAWGALAVGVVLLLNWTIRSLAQETSAAAETPVPVPSFETSIRQGNICAGPLALGHGFAVFLTNEEKTGFTPLDEGRTIGEMRSFAWAPDGKQLAIVGNTTGQGNLHMMDANSGELTPLLSNSELGYLMDAAWSRDGKQLLMWSSQNNRVVYVRHATGTGLREIQLDIYILGTPQFSPNGESIVFPGSDVSSFGLFEVILDDLKKDLINPRVEDESGFAWSPDGSRLAYMEMDRDLGEARLVSEVAETGAKTTLATLPIPKGSGSSIPEAANLSWSPDGKIVIFDFGRGERDRSVYVAYADGTGLVEAAIFAHAPAVSADGRCLAYISNGKAYLLDLKGLALTSPVPAPLLLAELPEGRNIPNFKQDKLQWRP